MDHSRRKAIGITILACLAPGLSLRALAEAGSSYDKVARNSDSRLLVYLNQYGKRVFSDKPINKPDFVLIYPRAGDEWRPTPLTDRKRDQYDVDIEYASRSFRVSEALIKAVIHAESLFDKNAVSRAGAQGLMQLMPKTALMMGVNDSFDARQNILGGTKYLRYLMDRFDNNLQLIVAAYNAGETNVRRYGGIPPFEETQNYVEKVMKLAKQYSKPS